MVSIIIPSRNEIYLNETILDIQKNARGKIEVIVIVEEGKIVPVKGVKYIYNEKPKGMRTAINQGVAAATGDFIMKTDAHCMFDEGFDVKLSSVHQDNWVQTPRRKRFDAASWKLVDEDRPPTDYMFIGTGFHGHKDNDKNRDVELRKVLIDDTEVFQGSCYFMKKEYFRKLGLLDDVHFGSMGSEAVEIALKTRHDGGRVIINKTTWYAHARLRRRYGGSIAEREKSRKYIAILAESL